jgi:hypothetical protein
MRDPQRLRDQASLARMIASRCIKKHRPRAQHYLLRLADQFETEARQIERQLASQKPLPVSAATLSRDSIDLGPLVGHPETKRCVEPTRATETV